MKDILKLLASIFICLSVLSGIIKNIVLSSWLFEEKDLNFMLSMTATTIWSLGWRSLALSVIWIY